ncbi:hypothetical protein ASF32_23905 [Methylobacterium sp. Leaf91]|nr:hypothetical protein ASF24_12680 [Methylobacterium sp. Leaf86]KQO88688.1 hypothetical protein ASF32_23905 [Methylobacterium sp. Leaf91]
MRLLVLAHASRVSSHIKNAFTLFRIYHTYKSLNEIHAVSRQPSLRRMAVMIGFLGMFLGFSWMEEVRYGKIQRLCNS